MEQVLHLHRADRRADLKSCLFGLLQGVPGGLHAFRIQRHRNCHDAVPDHSGSGLDPKGIDLILNNGLQLNDCHPQLIQQLAQLDLLLK